MIRVVVGQVRARIVCPTCKNDLTVKGEWLGEPAEDHDAYCCAVCKTLSLWHTRPAGPVVVRTRRLLRRQRYGRSVVRSMRGIMAALFAST